MYRVLSNITIQQNPTKEWPNRRATLGFNFCNTYEASNSWRDLTDNGKLILPKNLYFRDQFGVQHPLAGTNVNIGGFSSNAPLVLRGDSVTIAAGYRYFESKNASRETTKVSTIFTGYVSKITAAQPIEMELEDNMWLFKQTPAISKVYGENDTLETIMQDLVNQVNQSWKTSFKVNTLTTTKFGGFFIVAESCAQVLSRLQKKYGFEFYFRGNELRGGVVIYVESEAVTKNFTFQNNIIEDDLQYVRKDDIKLSAIARNTIVVVTDKKTKDGKLKSKRERLEVLVALKSNPGPKEIPYVFRQIKTGDVIPENDDGERHTFNGLGGTTPAQLAELAYQKLKIYMYSGLRGSFTTFGVPFVQMGDNANISDSIMPERNGLYKIKKVEYTGGVGGLRQKIHLDFRLNV